MKTHKIKKEVKQRKDVKQKKENILRLKGRHNTFINQQIQSKSSSSLSSDSEQSPPYSQDRNNLSIIPTFNFDNVPHTPTFYLPFNRINLEKCMERHRKKQQKYQEIDLQQIMVAKPRKRPYCHTCEVPYNDYLEHLSQKMHQQSIIKHPIQKDIIELCSKFNSYSPTDDIVNTATQSQ